MAEITDKATYRTESVLMSEGIWAVFYDGKPFNLRSSDYLNRGQGPKYKKVSFSNPGHAFSLARRLNKKFRTDKFAVIKLTDGEVMLIDE